MTSINVEFFTSAVGHNVEMTPNIWNVDPLHSGNVFSGDGNGVSHVGVGDVDLNVQVGDVLDAGVVGVVDERLHGNDGVHGGNETTVTQTHSVQPLDDLKTKLKLF
jgi:hypothetical protein